MLQLPLFLMCISNYLVTSETSFILLKGESDDSILRLAKNDGIVSKYVCLSYPLTLAGVTSIPKSNF